MFWNRSWPAVSQIESLTENPRCSMTCYYEVYSGFWCRYLWPTLTLKSKPTVGRMSAMNLSSVNLSISEDLPTPAAPSTSTLRLTRLSEQREWALFMWHLLCLADPEFWAVRCWGWAYPDTEPCTGDSFSYPDNIGSRHCDHWDKSPYVSK